MSNKSTYSEVLEGLYGFTDEQLGYTFVNCDGKRKRHYTFDALISRVAQYGLSLLKVGLKKGDRVGLVLTDNEEFTCCFLGALHVGLIPVPLAYPTSAAELKSYPHKVQYILGVSEASCLILSSFLRQHLEAGLSSCGIAIYTIDELEITYEQAPLVYAQPAAGVVADY